MEPIEPKNCPCPKVKCERHGLCPACREYHYRKGKLPYCERPAYLKTLDGGNSNAKPGPGPKRGWFKI